MNRIPSIKPLPPIQPGSGASPRAPARTAVRVRAPRRSDAPAGESPPKLPRGASVEEQMVARALTKRRVAWVPLVADAGWGRGRGRGPGAAVDFYLPFYNTVIRIQDELWHARPGATARDDVQALYLAAKDWRVVDLTDKEIHADVEGAVSLIVG